MLNDSSSDRAYSYEAGDMRGLVNGVTERVCARADLFVFEDASSVIRYDRDVPHNHSV